MAAEGETNWIEDMRVAHMLADNADTVTMDRFRATDLRVDAKPDLTEVTDADIAAEEAIRGVLKKARPRDAVHGEELADTGQGPRRWVIDPIDGTRNYVRGVPVWATLIALFDDDQPVLGCVSAPALGRRWWASRGGGAFTGKSFRTPRPCRVSQVASIADASLSYSDVAGWIATPHGQDFVDLMRRCWRTRGYGDFWSYMLLAEGAVDIACEPHLALHDMAACAIIVAEAGGQFSNLSGESGPVGPSAVATNGLLHPAVLAQLTASR